EVVHAGVHRADGNALMAPVAAAPVTLSAGAAERVRWATGGAADPCFQCGACTGTCPWNLVRDEPLSVRQLVRAAQLGLDSGNGAVWLCTGCGACEAACPRGVPVADVMTGLRRLAWEARKVPAGLPSLMWSCHWNGNPFGAPPSERTKWAKAAPVESFDAAKHDWLLFVGCEGAYDRRAQKVVRALATLLRHAGLTFGTLGDAEPCCGDCVAALGQTAYQAEMAEATRKLLGEKKVARIVTVSPHCWDAFTRRIPAGHVAPRAVHYTQLLAELVRDGKLSFPHRLALRAAFHDPCVLGRRGGEYEAPRALLGAVPGLELVEFPRSRETALCCGGGGGRMFLETPAAERLANLRVPEAKALGLQAVAKRFKQFWNY
ncbi:MAG: (Fe-S)-binding protein, partial [bacterium]